jgi:hypothetical protein
MPRMWAIGLILAAGIVAIIVASSVVRFDRPAGSPDKPVEGKSAQKQGGGGRI